MWSQSLNTVSHRETFLEETEMFWSQAEWLTRRVLHRSRKERVMKLAFLLGDLRFSLCPGAHKACGNGKWGAATACGEGSFLFCPADSQHESSVQSMPCPTAIRHSKWLKLAFLMLTPPGLNSCYVTFALTEQQKGWLQLRSLQTQSATQSPIKHKVTSHPAPMPLPSSPQAGRGCIPCSPTALCPAPGQPSITLPQPAPAAWPPPLAEQTSAHVSSKACSSLRCCHAAVSPGKDAEAELMFLPSYRVSSAPEQWECHGPVAQQATPPQLTQNKSGNEMTA